MEINDAENIVGARIGSFREGNLSLKQVRSYADVAASCREPLRGHLIRVADLAEKTGEKIGIGRFDLAVLYLSGLFHDIGKLPVRDGVLLKDGPLTGTEYGEVKKHTVYGGYILESVHALPELRAAARWHHERVDGNGYPDGLKGIYIPDMVKIISIADSYDAMTKDRPYRKGLPVETALEEIERGKGTQFDPEIADIFTGMIRKP